MLQAIIENLPESRLVKSEDAPKLGPDLLSYKKFIVALSGGKDSQVVALHLFEELMKLGLSWAEIRERVEFWHHDIDGHEDDEGTGGRFMDWPVTKAYCKAFADAFGIPIYFSWKVGGFWREMHRKDSKTAPIRFEYPDENGHTRIGEVGGTRGKNNTRRRFPQVSADLSVRWCSAYLKIDVCAAAIRGQKRFEGIKTLVLTGERAEESAARSKYETFEPNRANLTGKRIERRVDHWRPVHGWSETRVWETLKDWRINVHPAYRLGWGRVSCATCIFGNANQWASVSHVLPDQTMKVWEKESEFDQEAKANPKLVDVYDDDGNFIETKKIIQGGTIKRKESVGDQISKGEVYEAARNVGLVQTARGETFNEPIFLDRDNWTLPAGAFGESCGPT